MYDILQESLMNKSKTKIIILILLILSLLGGVFILLEKTAPIDRAAEVAEGGAPTESNKPAQQSQEPEGVAIRESEKELPQKTESSNPQSHIITGTVHYSSVDNGTLIVRSTIHQLLPSGTCTITVSDGQAALFTQEVSITQNPSSSSCMGFDIPIDRLGKGQRNIIINVRSGDKSGTLTGLAVI